MYPEFNKTISDADPEHELIWDEYKYRHELIWKHMIRSSVIIIGIIILPFSKDFLQDKIVQTPWLLIFLGVASIIYILFTFHVINKELLLFEEIKIVHRRKQFLKFGIHKKYNDQIWQEKEKKKQNQWLNKYLGIGFQLRVNIYLGFLLIIAIISFILNFSQLNTYLQCA
ncbi:hypothetical protein [Marinigracilibium pacificum]|uniref:DUF4231 domain-containing protein n=1 Tax=Marinigracilibium pacificum TaxID=2729599 RepID=A0A848IX03_9BACT|nr:hypothetical protein [Marinigracilibium pacificum]NMM47698.1 hypothetical protein [Marinigracilibium pacificum]